ncbi:MAG: carbonate dehydratase [Desulfobacteraceae bacterium]|jgi:carbonic anhydrase/acetyltransferase-like protein (isoleucine patch superfamily)|nr:MAG: carbonate dehydratase [Desulfobacteraceae bacterium]
MPAFENIRVNLAGDRPRIHPDSLIDPSAQIIGNVIIEKDVFVGPLAVIRADERGSDGTVQPITIGEEVNIQDGVIIHTHAGSSVTIGARSSIAHGVTIHGPCTIGAECFLAMRATIYRATLEDNVWIGMAAIVMKAKLEQFTLVPAGAIVRSHHDIGRLNLVSHKEQEYMKNVLDSASQLREDYLNARERVKKYLNGTSTAKIVK